MATFTKAKSVNGFVRTVSHPAGEIVRTSRVASKPREQVGKYLKARIEGLLKIKTGKGCGCTTLATQMDTWGVAGCEQHRDEIVKHLVGNREMLADALPATFRSFGSLAVSAIPEFVLREGANWLLNKAIEDTRLSITPRVAVPARVSDRISSPRSRPDMVITKRRSVRMELSEAIPPARFVFAPDPEWSSQVRHLTYHIWPTKQHDGWKWNLEELSHRWPLFNGKKILGVVTSPETLSPEAVVEFAATLGMSFDHLVRRPNSPKLREVVTWVPMLTLLNPQSAGKNEVVFSAHAKGTRHQNLTQTLESWTRIMYSACLDDWTLIESELSRYLATGCFKRYNNFRTPGNDCWHYSGTFFWWRLAELGKRRWEKVDQKFFGTESWLGLHCKREETGCLFVDGVLNLYDAKYMQDVIVREWDQRQAAKFTEASDDAVRKAGRESDDSDRTHGTASQSHAGSVPLLGHGYE